MASTKLSTTEKIGKQKISFAPAHGAAIEELEYRTSESNVLFRLREPSYRFANFSHSSSLATAGR